jgi:hypothetical protein
MFSIRFKHTQSALAAKQSAWGASMGAFLLVFSLLAISPVNEVVAQTKQPATASAPKHSGNWDDLSVVQQKILAPLEEDWSYLSKERRQKWIQVANLYPKMKRSDQLRGFCR